MQKMPFGIERYRLTPDLLMLLNTVILFTKVEKMDMSMNE